MASHTNCIDASTNGNGYISVQEQDIKLLCMTCFHLTQEMNNIQSLQSDRTDKPDKFDESGRSSRCGKKTYNGRPKPSNDFLNRQWNLRLDQLIETLKLIRAKQIRLFGHCEVSEADVQIAGLQTMAMAINLTKSASGAQHTSSPMYD